MSDPLTDFFECEMPTALAFLAQGGPMFSTQINESMAGAEYRIRNWASALSKWTIDLTNKPIVYFDLARNFFYAVGGQACGWRFKDCTDFQATNQLIDHGDGTQTQFQLIKTYDAGDREYVRTIIKPVTSAVYKSDGSHCLDTVTIYVDGVEQTPNTDYVLDYTTGVIVFATPPAPSYADPAAITADFEFHVPCRFTTDSLMAQLEPSFVSGGEAIVSWPQIEIKEIRDVGLAIRDFSSGAQRLPV